MSTEFGWEYEVASQRARYTDAGSLVGADRTGSKLGKEASRQKKI